ncbi:MAG: hypothetical protein ACI4KB_02875 [Oscillospiraceae bacterium]
MKDNINESDKSSKIKIIISSAFLAVSLIILGLSVASKSSANNESIRIDEPITTAETTPSETSAATSAETTANITETSAPTVTEAPPVAVNSVIYPESGSDVSPDIDFSKCSFVYGILSCGKPWVPLYEDPFGNKRYILELSHTILKITGSENDMYRVSYNPEGATSQPVDLYVEKRDISFNMDVPSWKEKYEEIIRLKSNANEDSMDRYYKNKIENNYLLKDMNSDGIPELITLTYSTFSDANYIAVHSIYNNELVTYEVRGSHMSYYPETGYIGVSSIARLALYYFEDGILKEECSFLCPPQGDCEIDGTPISREEYNSLVEKYTGSTKGSSSSGKCLSVTEILSEIENY